MTHECIKHFQTRVIDDCNGEAYHKCSGTTPMILEVYSMEKDGTECYYDNWIEIEVKYCPFCGLKDDPS